MKQMKAKRIMALLLAMTVTVVGLCACGSKKNVTASVSPGDVSSEALRSDKAFSAMSEEELQPYIQAAMNAVEAYDRARISDKQDFPSLGLATSERCGEYLRLRFAFDTVGNLTVNTREYVSGDYHVWKYRVVKERLVCYVNSDIQYHYRDVNVDAGEGECTQVVMENPQSPVIVDWYNAEPPSFDTQMRNYGLNMTVPSNWLENYDMEEIRAKAKQITEQAKEAMENE